MKGSSGGLGLRAQRETVVVSGASWRSQSWREGLLGKGVALGSGVQSGASLGGCSLGHSDVTGSPVQR